MGSEWIAVTDRLPEQSMKVKWLCDDGVEDVGFYYGDKKIFGTLDHKSENPITHWKPLNALFDLTNTVTIDLSDVDVSYPLEYGQFEISPPDSENEIQLSSTHNSYVTRTWLTMYQARQLALFLLKCSPPPLKPENDK